MRYHVLLKYFININSFNPQNVTNEVDSIIYPNSTEEFGETGAQSISGRAGF